MPLYEYECTNQHRFELRQGFYDTPVASCPTCEGKSRRVMHSVAVHYKGSGFYTTDYGRGKSAGSSSSKEADTDTAKQPVSSSTDSDATTKGKSKAGDAKEE